MIEIGVDSFATIFPTPKDEHPVSGAERMEALLQEVETADRVGLVLGNIIVPNFSTLPQRLFCPPPPRVLSKFV